MTQRIILDTNVLVAAFTSAEGASRQVLRRVLAGQATALISLALFEEYRDVLSRDDFLNRTPLSQPEVNELLDAVLAATELVTVFFSWRPSLRDEGDNHVFELAVAAGDAPLISHNVRDFSNAQLKFPALRIMTPAQWLDDERKR